MFGSNRSRGNGIILREVADLLTLVAVGRPALGTCVRPVCG